MAKKMFKNTTLKQKFVLYFNEKGFEEVETRSSKYKVFKGPKLFYFIGRSGGLRTNSKNTVTGSYSHTDSFKKVINEWSDKRDQTEKVEV